MKWTRDHQLVAFHLYTKIPFGKIHQTNPDIVKYAGLMGRSPSSLAMKLSNIASLDPEITSTGRRGLTGAAKADMAMWKERNRNIRDFDVSAQEAAAEMETLYAPESLETGIFARFPQFTELDLLFAELIFPLLIEIAPKGRKITYGEVVDRIQERHPDIPGVATFHHRHVGRRLGTIWEFTKSQGCPHLGALVVLGDTRECGEGLPDNVDPEEERGRIREFDWSRIELDFQSHLSRVKAIQKLTPNKTVHRNYESARGEFFKYWNNIKNELPIVAEDITPYRVQLISSIQDGMAPELALSEILLKLLRKTKSVPSPGRVYLGEYQDTMTGAPLFGQIKIGFTSRDVENREAELSGGVDGPMKFKMLRSWGFKPGYAYAVEQNLHGIFTKLRRQGEFFDSLEGQLESLIGEIIEENFAQFLDRKD